MYNNFMYALLGHVTEQLGGAPWHSLIHREIFTQLNMHSSTFIAQANFTKNVALPHVLHEGVLEPVSYTPLQ